MGRIAAPVVAVAAVVTGLLVTTGASPSTQSAVPVASTAPAPAPVIASTPTRPAPTAAVTTTNPPTRPTATPTTTPSAPKPAKTKAKKDPSPSSTPSATRTKLKLVDTEFATIDLNVRVEPTQDAKVTGEIHAGDEVSVTDSTRGGYQQISFHGQGRWVKKQYLVESKKTALAAASGISDSPCAKSPRVEHGLTPDAVKVYRAVCARFPQVTSFGGLRGGGGNHGSGRAVDNMIGDSDAGLKLANWVRSNAARLGVSEVIYRQHIWTVQRGGDGWRSMSDRGSATANHEDHVHVSVYGNRATG